MLSSAGLVVGESVAGFEGYSVVGASAAKATPAEAAIRPSAAVAANRDEVVFFIVSPGMNVVRDECVTLTSTGRVASGVLDCPTTLPDHYAQIFKNHASASRASLCLGASINPTTAENCQVRTAWRSR